MGKIYKLETYQAVIACCDLQTCLDTFSNSCTLGVTSNSSPTLYLSCRTQHTQKMNVLLLFTFLLLGVFVKGEGDVMGRMRDQLREKYGGNADTSEMRVFYKKCTDVTTRLVCDWIRNEAENDHLEPLKVSPSLDLVDLGSSSTPRREVLLK